MNYLNIGVKDNVSKNKKLEGRQRFDTDTDGRVFRMQPTRIQQL